jgi:hypothetical protein
MSAEAHVFPEHDLLVSRFQGVLTDELLISYYQKLFSLGEGSSSFSELVDFRCVERTEVSSYALSVIAEGISAAYESITSVMKCAVVAPSDLSYGLSRMYQLGSSPPNVRLQVFRTFDSALSWLGLCDERLTEELSQLNERSPSAVLRLDA